MEQELRRYEYYIIGAGPAGATLARVLSDKGFNVLVADAAPKPGMKPCGRGIPDSQDLPFKIPSECVQREVKGATLYVDGVRAFTVTGLKGYIIDRECLTRSLLEGSDLALKAYYDMRTGTLRLNGEKVKLDPRRVIIAGGNPFYPGEKINAVQEIYKGETPDELIIYFDTELIGYYWIFPGAPGYVEVGVGGFSDVSDLRTRLRRFLRENKEARSTLREGPFRVEGAKIAVGGVAEDLVSRVPVHIGEAAGYVLPLTGEGIRPSIVSAYRLAEALTRGGSPRDILKSDITRSITLHRKILNAVKSMKPELRRELLLSIPERLHVKVALGKVSARDIMAALARRPTLLFKLRKFMGGGVK
ncbi:MAG: NAD(P)/FAD-dependent oxidoreductase [Desulfurococcales archaeon]|nr:NAD(P)/FAD-dependent oxidoreductase [Desulfurococcales archaeon]